MSTPSNRSCRRLALAIAGCCCLFTTSAWAGDWPQYLGPARNSTSPEKGLLRSWPADGPKVEWTVALGRGFGGPVVKAGKVYLLDRDDKVGDNMRCFDLSSGKELWNFGYNAPGSVEFPGSRSVPAVDGNNVYSCGHNGDLYCIDINTHKPVWNKNIWTDYGGGRLSMWAVAQCPLVYGDLLIVAPQAPQVGVVAYDKLTGQEKWKTSFLGNPGFNGYVSPSIVKVGQEDHLVMITASAGRSGSGGKVVGIDPLTGKTLWEYTNWSCWIPVPSAVDAGEGRILFTGAYNAGAAMIKVAKKDDGSYEVNELFKTIEFGSHTKPPILLDGCFYVQYTTNERSDGLVCMRMDGKIMWKTGRSPAFNKGSMILADGLILATDGTTKLYLIEPDPSAFKPHATAELLGDGNQNWAPMALSDGKLLIRDQAQMKCLKVAQ
jgi:outer membrane protein assembly factor BamB